MRHTVWPRNCNYAERGGECRAIASSLLIVMFAARSRVVPGWPFACAIRA
jgi:hypothetical protein